jgi:hypothetical protein
MILIDETYFTGELKLPNLPVNGAVSGVALALQTVGENNLDVFVDKYVTDYLVRLFGRELALRFLEEIAKPLPSQIWVDVQDQLLMEFGAYKASPLANYVYFMVNRDAVTKTTQAGEADPDFDYAENVSNRRKFSRAWNEMARMTVRVFLWFCAHEEAYRDYAGDYSGREVHSIATYINDFGI